MDNIKDDRYYIDKIITDLGFVIEHTKGMSKEEMEENALLNNVPHSAGGRKHK